MTKFWLCEEYSGPSKTFCVTDLLFRMDWVEEDQVYAESCFCGIVI